MQTSVLTFDAEARMLLSTYLPPTYPGGIGSHPWDHVVPADIPIVRRAVDDCLNQRIPATCQARWINCGTWRVWFTPIDSETTPAVMVAESFLVPAALHALNDRVLAVCQLIAAGYTEEQIAEALGMNPRTVRRARHSAAAAIGIPTHELCVWCGAHQRFLEPL